MNARRQHRTQRTRRAMYFTLDAMFAAAIIATAIVLLLSYPPRDQDTRQLETVAQDAVRILGTARVGELPNALTPAVLATNLTNENDTVLRAIGVLWATNNPLAQTYTDAVLADFAPDTSYGVYAEGQYLAGINITERANAARIAVAKQQVSGIAQGLPVSGTTATGLLKKVENKSTAAFTTFGGFIGQGTITAILILPGDFAIERLGTITLELDVQAPFTLRVNGDHCGDYTPVNTANASPDRWTITACDASFTAGDNEILLEFAPPIDTAYVSGGFLRVDHTTDEPATPLFPSPSTKRLNGVEGIINVYDAVSFPQNLTSLELTLHYTTNRTNTTFTNPFYVTIGNTTVLWDNTSNGTTTVTLTDANLTPLLNYSELEGKTVPIRVGFDNLTFSTFLFGASDVALVTDVSGSMAWNFINNNAGTLRECTDALINASSTQRLSVAKCISKDFADEIINITGNRLALIAYESSTQTSNTVPLTTNLTTITNTIGNTTSGYVAGGGTCICCGINSAVTELTSGITRTTLVTTGSTWDYWFAGGFVTEPANDTNGNTWFDTTYLDASGWPSGPAVLGALEDGSGPTIVTDMGNSSPEAFYPNLADMALDNSTPEVDFTSGMNSTGNTFSIGGANDGWDWQGGVYGYDNDVAFPGAVAGRIVIDTNTSPSNRNNCANDDCSGAYGISVNITPALWTIINTNGSIRLAFDYAWISNPTNPFQGSDEVWIKARWTAPGPIVTNLGTELSNTNGDNTPEIAVGNNPDVEFSGTFSQEISDLVTGPGVYYLDLGGKLSANDNDEWGRFAFDNILLTVTNRSDIYYLRHEFTITNTSAAQSGFLNIMSDDRATVYVNGELLLDQGIPLTGAYWNERGVRIEPGILQAGTNTVAVRIENNRGAARFDLELIGLNTTRQLAMLSMTDGEATNTCGAQGTGNAAQDAIQASCDAREEWGITVHSVGLGPGAGNDTMESVAACGGGLFIASSDAAELADFYTNVAINIVDATLRSQSVVIQGSFQASRLFDDSTVRFWHNAILPQAAQNEVVLTTQSPPLGSCTPTVAINPSVRVLSARVTSYSGDHWTDLVTANGNEVYNLSTYQTPYIALGDPYEVRFPDGVIVPGTNQLVINTGDSPTNATGCAPDNTLITDIAVPISPTYTPVLENAIGCSWTVELDIGGFQTLAVPRTYAGAKTCSYTNASVAFDLTDAYDVATANLLTSLDYDRDGRIFISLADEDVEIIVNTVSNVPYLWGPSQVEVQVWR